MAGIVDRVLATLKRKGAPAQLLQPTSSGPAYDPTPGAPVRYDCFAVEIGASAYQVLNSGGRLLTSDKMFLIAAANLVVAPTPALKMVFGGVEYFIVGEDKGLGVKTYATGDGSPVAYEVQCRK